MSEQQYTCHECGQPYARWDDNKPCAEFYCQPCHTKHFARSPRHTCLLCGERKLYTAFAQDYQGYNIRNFRICCLRCEPTFNALPRHEAIPIIRRALYHYYKPGQVIYTLDESDTGQVRYAGRTYDPRERMKQRKQAAYPYSFDEAKRRREADPLLNIYGQNIEVRYTEGFWLYDLYARGAEPVMKIVEQVSDPPFVAEREVRWICHLLQQGADLINTCTPDLVRFVRELSLNFLHDPLDPDMLAKLGSEARPGPCYAAFIRQFFDL